MFSVYEILVKGESYIGFTSKPIEERFIGHYKSAYKNKVELNKVLEVVPDHYKGVTRDIYNWMPKGDIRYTAFRIGVTSGCSALNQGVFYHGKK